MHPLVPGARVPGDWYDGAIPENVEAGAGVMVESAAVFRAFRSTRRPGLRIGDRVTLHQASLVTEEDATVEIGDDSYVAAAVIVAASSVSIGRRVLVSGGVTIVDADFHPLALAERVADTIAIAPGGDPSRRPPFRARPVVIEDDVWLGWNATVLSGVTIGRGALVDPGAVVTQDVPAGATVAGNPARPVPGAEG